ncbi:MAG: NAD(P)-dependent oxidoreductase [Spirochaetaceae bacterium]
MDIGFIGLGVMGSSMARNLLQAGHNLTVYNRTKGKAEELLSLGAAWAETPAQVALAADSVITIVGYPQDVEEVYFGEVGVLQETGEGMTLIDMTTSSPALAEKIAEAAEKKGARALDAPVSGGDVGAREGTLSIMVGGDKDAFDRALPILRILGKNIVLQGGAGAGQHTKMCNQIAIAGTMLGMSEALSYARRSGLDPETVLESISGGAAASWSLSNLAPRILEGDFDPGFYIRHFIKDMEIAQAEAKRFSHELPALALALASYKEVAKEESDLLGTQALYLKYESRR